MALPARLRLIASIAIVFLFGSISAQNPFRSFQYKYSFKPPYLAQKDGSVPFWEYSGSKGYLNHLRNYFVLILAVVI